MTKTNPNTMTRKEIIATLTGAKVTFSRMTNTKYLIPLVVELQKSTPRSTSPVTHTIDFIDIQMIPNKSCVLQSGAKKLFLRIGDTVKYVCKRRGERTGTIQKIWQNALNVIDNGTQRELRMTQHMAQLLDLN